MAGDAIPSTSTAPVPTLTGGQSRGKDLSLLMKSHGRDKYYTPRDSLYFREKMVKMKQTARNRKTLELSKQPRRPLKNKSLRKTLARLPGGPKLEE